MGKRRPTIEIGTATRRAHLNPLPFLGQGTHLHHIHDPIGVVCEPHHHLYYELDYVLKGRGVFAVGARKVNVEAGDLVYFARGVYHWRKSDITHALELCNLTLASRDMQRFLEAHPEAETTLWPWWRHWKAGELTDRDSRLVLRKMTRAMRQHTGRLPPARVADILPGVVELLSRNHKEEVPGADLTALAQRIRRSPHCAFRLDTEAARLGVSRWWLSRVFKRRFALSIWEYRDYARVEQAILRLLSSDISVKSLGRALGFSSTAQFINTFKRLAGQTPGRFRIHHQDKNGIPRDTTAHPQGT